MTPSGPLLSIVIPVYNAEATVRRTIASLGNIAPDNRPQVEVVVVNDGSTDGSAEAVRQSAVLLPELKWRVVTKPNGGLASARNAALREATGDWVFFLDADDELATDLVPLLRASAQFSCVGLSLEYRRDGHAWKSFSPRRLTSRTHLATLTAANIFAVSSLVFRRAATDTFFEESLPALEDWWFWISNPRIFQTMRVWGSTTVGVIHIHGGNMSSNTDRMGRGRSRVAGLALERYAAQLTRVQRNNLLIQEQIGLLQQGKRPRFSTYVTVPCDLKLYAKLWVYTLSALAGVAATPYRRKA